jgi:RecA-family ATPase
LITRKIFIPVGRGTSSEVYVDGAACVAQFISLEKVSRLKNHAGQTMNFTGAKMRAIIAKDERNHKYYKDYISNPKPTPPPYEQPTNGNNFKIVLTETNAEVQLPTQAAPSNKITKLTTIDYSTLMKQEYTPLKFSISDILPQGLFILASAPKIGKSWLILDMCHSIATGADLWGYNTTKSDVLYIALEDNHRRLQDRLRKIITNEPPIEPLNLHLAVSAKGIHDGLIEQVDEFMKEHPNTGFIAIDTLEHIRKGEIDRKDRGLYSTDYADMQILRTITRKYDGITLMLIHHTRKMYDADPLFTVTGSTGLTGAVDGIWVLDKEKRAENKAVLSILNRDTKGYAFKLELDEHNCKWQFLGECEDAEKDDIERLALAINALFTQIDIDRATEWKGNATALCTALSKIDDRLTITERTIKNKLNIKDLQDLLKNKYSISYKYQEFGRNIILTKSNAK